MLKASLPFFLLIAMDNDSFSSLMLAGIPPKKHWEFGEGKEGLSAALF